MEDRYRYEQEASAASMAYAASCVEKELQELGEKAIEAHATLLYISAALEMKIQEAQAIADSISKIKEN